MSAVAGCGQRVSVVGNSVSHVEVDNSFLLDRIGGPSRIAFRPKEETMKPKIYESDPHSMVDRVSHRAQELISEVTKNLSDISKSSSTASTSGVIFFPNGIQLIHVKLSVGVPGTPVVSLDLEISGQKGAQGVQGIEMAEDPRIRPSK